MFVSKLSLFHPKNPSPHYWNKGSGANFIGHISIAVRLGWKVDNGKQRRFSMDSIKVHSSLTTFFEVCGIEDMPIVCKGGMGKRECGPPFWADDYEQIGNIFPGIRFTITLQLSNHNPFGWQSKRVQKWGFWTCKQSVVPLASFAPTVHLFLVSCF